MDNILALHHDLKYGHAVSIFRYKHGSYQHFHTRTAWVLKCDIRKFFASVDHCEMNDFVSRSFRLEMHPDKVFVKTLASGIDLLGWVHFPDHCVLRTSTKRRMLKRMAETSDDAVRDSYLGLLSHGNTRKLQWTRGV